MRGGILLNRFNVISALAVAASYALIFAWDGLRDLYAYAPVFPRLLAYGFLLMAGWATCEAWRRSRKTRTTQEMLTEPLIMILGSEMIAGMIQRAFDVSVNGASYGERILHDLFILACGAGVSLVQHRLVPPASGT